MKYSAATLETLAQVNPHFSEEPQGWNVYDAEAGVRKFRATVESVLGPVSFDVDSQDCTSIASFALPVQSMLVPENTFAGGTLSKFDRLFTIGFPWDVLPDKLQALITALEGAGFTYVPFELFADPATYRWEYMKAFSDSRTPPPEGGLKLRHEEVFNSLFGYP